MDAQENSWYNAPRPTGRQNSLQSIFWAMWIALDLATATLAGFVSSGNKMLQDET